MTHQFLEYNGIMVPVNKYMKLKKQEKQGKSPLLSDVTEEKEVEVVETPVETKKDSVFEEKRKPWLPNKAKLREILDERKISYTKNNCRKTLYEKYIKSN